MNETEISFLLWGCGVLLAILAFIGALAVRQLMSMATDINEIKTAMSAHSAKHDGLEKRVDKIEERVYA